MDKQKQKAIEHHNVALINNIDPQAVVDNMFVSLLSLVEKEFIKKSNSTRRDTNCELIFILFRKREELEPFERFVEALKKTDASHKILAKAILKTYKQDKGTTGFETVSRTSLTGAEETNYGLQM
uniref:Caspase recruitment domain-containing protein n=1 Tax=Plectus sambesii TaxID=2011161 RepID=A0A914XBP5_9BILA